MTPAGIGTIRAGRALGLAVLAGSLSGCGDYVFDPCGGTCPQLPDQDCARLATTPFLIGPLPGSSGSELRLAAGDGRGVFLVPSIESPCTRETSVTWSLEPEAVATLASRDPAYRGAWITGVRPGAGTVSVVVSFAGGAIQTARREIVVDPPVTPSGTTVADGEVDAIPFGSVFIPFRLPDNARRVDLVADWDATANSVGVALYRGTCSGVILCAGLTEIQLPVVRDVKPVRNSVSDLAAGPYTLRVVNHGHDFNVIRYSVASSGR